MMKKIGLCIGILLLTGNMGLWAQGNQLDAYNLTATELGGTARSMAMGGAFGALGGDLSVISNNPAGLGIYRSSEISGTLDLSMVKASSDWSGVSMDKNKTRFSPNNFGFELYFPTSGSVRNWNLGFSYNRLKNYYRTYRASSNGQNSSLADYIAMRASNSYLDNNGNYAGIPVNDIRGIENGYNPYDNWELGGHWLPVLGYGSDMIEQAYSDVNDVYRSRFGRQSGNSWETYSPDHNMLSVLEKGHMDEYNIGFGMNVSNFMFLGASLSVTDVDYEYISSYDETFKKSGSLDDYLYLDNWLNTEGTAISFSVGAIMNLQMLRLGVAYNSPRWYEMTDYYNAQGGTAIGDRETDGWTPETAYSEYRFRTPGKWIFSGALVLGQTALISADYELMNYKNMHFADTEGDDYNFGVNYDIEEDYTWSHTLKIGGEAKVTPQFAVRAGYMMQTSPMKDHLVNNNLEVLPSGTIPHFIVTSKPTHYYTVGLGYRFTPNFYMDMACVYRYNSANLYAFSNTYFKEPDYGIQPVASTPAKLKTESTRVILTLGYKF